MNRTSKWKCSFFFNDTATTEIYTLSLHDALPIFQEAVPKALELRATVVGDRVFTASIDSQSSERARSEEHTSELQSRQYLVCRLLLEKKIHNRSCLPYLSGPCLFLPHASASGDSD